MQISLILREKRFEIASVRLLPDVLEWRHDVVDGRYVKRPGTKEDNWVWTPQHVVDMHRPREWCFVEFIDDRK